ncbi:hypothetical protein ADIMK_3268 [Marinobacterium lacunae]|uniref:Uncharacterized protein n=2 Tax=Marinobacterium lacunae TaxID=1232683 RepID=A0A081FW91_9GAMM|nr:hypothetical protein ADIMK_3268 [Marinobacterium lacunae]
MLERYTERVGNAIEQTIQTDYQQALAQRPALPPRRLRLLEIEPINEGLIDVLDFRHCDLLHVIAERNTSLGKLAGYSQRLIYELKILPALRACHARIIDQKLDVPDRLKLRLTQIITQKEQSFGALLWNTFYTSDEMEQQFALNQPPLPLQGVLELSSIKPALDHFVLLADLVNKSSWNTPEFGTALEEDFESLYRSNFGAQWLTSITLLTHTLERTADAIEQRLSRRPICFNNKPNNQANIIRNVFQRFYAGELQPYLSLVDRQGREWLSYHHRIMSQLPVPEAASNYFHVQLDLTAPEGIWQRYIDARDRHTRAWQRLLRQCGMMPGS